MEISFRELRCKDVINIIDGRNLGRPNDVVFTYPQGCVFGIAVPGKRGFNIFKRNDIFIPLKNIIKIYPKLAPQDCVIWKIFLKYY